MSGSDKPPSRPAKGLSLTLKVMAIVGSSILTKGSGSAKPGTDGVADVNIRYSGNTNNFANAGALYFGSLQSLQNETV